MASFAVTDLTFTTIRTFRKGGNRTFRETFGTIKVPTGALTYAAGGVPISGITNPATGLVVANSIGLACPGLGCPTELLYLTVLANGNAAGLDDGYVCLFDNACQAEGTVPTVAHKLRLMTRATGAGTVAANTVASLTAAGQTFTGDALAAHGHVLHLNDADQTDGATTRVNAATNKIGANTGSDIEVASVADATGVGGIIRITAGTPSGTNATSAVTGTLTTGAYTPTAPTTATGRMIEHPSAALGEDLTIYVIAVGW